MKGKTFLPGSNTAIGCLPYEVHTMKTTIKTLAFGDKSAIARTLATSGAELKASILESATLPILSNYLAGFTTFGPLIKGTGHNTKCPLQAALWALMFTAAGKARTTPTARAVRAVFALAEGKAADQATHDATLDEAIILIAEALTPASSTKKPAAKKPNYEALYAGAQITIAELEARIAELTAPVPEPATV